MAHGFVARLFFCAFALSLSFSASADAFDDARLSVERHFKSGAEPTVVEAGWTDDWVFKVAVQDNGRSRDGFAEYVCQELYSAGFKGKRVLVRVLDLAGLDNGEWINLGTAQCQ